MIRLALTILLALGLGATATVQAQPTLENIWPNLDGTRWEYGFVWTDNTAGTTVMSPAFLQLEGHVTTPGGEAQVLLGEHAPVPDVDLPLAGATPGLPPLLAAIWRARPNLRERLAALPAAPSRQMVWNPLLLHDGYFMKTAVDIEMWQESWDHPTWIYLEDDFTVGASFVHQLLPEIVDDIFLHGTVMAVDAVVDTPAGTFVDAVEMTYLVDLGTSIVTDDQGNLLGTLHGEYHGHVHYVPDVGPVELLEEYTPFVWVDCGDEDCPPEWLELVGVAVTTQTLALTSLPVATVERSWSGVKSLYAR